MTKLNRKKIRWIIRHCAELRDISTKEAADIYNISQRRVQQLLKQYRETGEIPVLKKERIIEEVWNLFYGITMESTTLSGLKSVRLRRMLIDTYLYRCKSYCEACKTMFLRKALEESLPGLFFQFQRKMRKEE